jgi:hypothetical protein
VIMEGRRFGAGVLAGVLLAFVIVAAAGNLGSVPGAGIFAPSESAMTASSTSTVSATMADTVTSSSSSTISTAPQSATSSNATFGTGAASSTTSASMSSQTVSATTASSQKPIGNLSSSLTNDQNAANSAGTPSFSSQIYNIVHQPALSNAVIFLPVLVAILVGTVLYKASIRDREEPGQD